MVGFPKVIKTKADLVNTFKLAKKGRLKAADWLAANLGPEARGQLERLTDCSLEQGDLTERALFRCGLSLGLELGALSRLPG